MIVNGVDGLLPFLDGTEMFIEKGQVKWLASTNRQHLVLFKGAADVIKKKKNLPSTNPHPTVG